MYKSVSREGLKRMIDRNEEFVLVDVLSEESFQERHIPGAINIPLDEIEKMAPKLINKNEKVIVYCGSFECSSSTKAAEKLIELGYKKVYDFEGGLKDWQEGGYPLVGVRRARVVGE